MPRAASPPSTHLGTLASSIVSRGLQFCVPESSTPDVIVRREKNGLWQEPCPATKLGTRERECKWSLIRLPLEGRVIKIISTEAKSLRMSTPLARQDWSDLLFRSSEGAIARTVGHPVHLSRAPQLPHALPGHVWNFERQPWHQQKGPTRLDHERGRRGSILKGGVRPSRSFFFL